VTQRNPYLFVVGCPRSGTTLLQRMLDNHPALAVTNDSHFIPAAIGDLPPAGDVPLTPEIVDRVHSFRSRTGKTGFFRLGLPGAVVDEAATRARTYGGFVAELYSEVARLREKPLAGEKTPDYVRHLPLLHQLFPWARMVHVIRDGRSVALSLLEWAAAGRGPARYDLWSREPVAMCALWWRWQVRSGLRDGRNLGAEHYHDVRYEQLVADPTQVLRDLSDFLELPYCAEMLRYHEGRVRLDPGLSAKQAWLPPVSGLRDWRKAMAGGDLEVFEAVAGDLLSELGYERACDTISPELTEKSGEWQRWWESVTHRAHTPRVSLGTGKR
jgi:Sulfotransferase family